MEMRTKLEIENAQQLKETFSSPEAFQRIVALSTNKFRAKRDALACVLIEKSLSPAIADITGSIYSPN